MIPADHSRGCLNQVGSWSGSLSNDRYILDRFCPGCAPIPLLQMAMSLESGHDGDGHNRSSGGPSVPNLSFRTLEYMTILERRF